jgi:hypothetical protein
MRDDGGRGVFPGNILSFNYHHQVSPAGRSECVFFYFEIISNVYGSSVAVHGHSDVNVQIFSTTNYNVDLSSKLNVCYHDNDHNYQCESIVGITF